MVSREMHTGGLFMSGRDGMNVIWYTYGHVWRCLGGKRRADRTQSATLRRGIRMDRRATSRRVLTGELRIHEHGAILVVRRRLRRTCRYSSSPTCALRLVLCCVQERYAAVVVIGVAVAVLGLDRQFCANGTRLG